MSKSALIVHDGEFSHRMIITHRDWGLVHGPLFVEGLIFSMSFGVYDNFTVAGGVPEGSSVIRRGRNLFNAARALLSAVERDADLFRFDYSYSFANDTARYNAGRTITLRGRSGILRTRPKGYCFVKLLDPDAKGVRIAEFIDLRIVRELATDDKGIVKVHRRSAEEMRWPETLPQLLEFLQPRVGKELVVEHVDRVS